MAATTTTRDRILAVGLVFALFTAGAVAGVAGYRMWLDDPPAAAAPHGHRTPAEVLDKFRTHLDLTDDQARAVGARLDRVHAHVRALHERTHHDLRAIHERARAEILELLTPEQAEAYQEMIDKVHRAEHH